jgi:hypothetical protein
MTSRTHVEQMNGSNRGPLVDSVRPYPDQIRFTLNRMNGASFWAYSIWRAPEGANLVEEIPFSEDYIQCAGSAEAMTIELRMRGTDGASHQYTVGRPEGEQSGEPSETIRWDDGRHSTRVFANEVFTADEAADVLYAYYLTDTVPPGYQLRELDLTAR